MRVLVLLVASILAFGGLAGCMGGTKDGATTNPTPAPGTGTGGTGGSNGGGPAQVKVLAPLNSAITLDAPAWIASGTEVPVKLAAPTGAKGALTYAWASGPLPGTVAVMAMNMDTGSKGSDYIASAASKSLTFSMAGVYAMHCHPHPYMRSNVTVVEGYAGPKTVEVSIIDGANQNEYRFVPENIVIGVGTTVTYKNVGTQPHTATSLGAPEPALKALPLKTDAGKLKLDGNGWVRVLAIVQDSEGRIGIVNKSIYVTPTLPVFATQTETMEFTYGASPLATTPAAAAAKSTGVQLAQGGKVTINYTFADAAAQNGAPQNLAQVEVHFTKDGETQDTFTSPGNDNTGSIGGKAIAGAYTLKVVPVQGASMTGTIVIDVEYELVPPAPAGPSAGGHDDSGGAHQH